MKEKITEILNNKSKPSLTLIEINDALGLKTSEDIRMLEDVLNDMATSIDGKIYYSEKKKTYTLLENLDFIKGVLEIKNDNKFGFVRVEGFDKDVYIGKNNINGASDGDIVLIEITNKLKQEGRIIKIVKRNDNQLVGKLVLKNNKYFIKQLGSKDKMIEISKNKLLYASESDIVAVKKTSHGYEVVNVIDTYNDVNDKSVVDSYIKGFAYQYGFNSEFPKEVLEELENIPNEIMVVDLKNRKDLRDLEIFTIDGADTKDVDDAISLKILDNGNYELGVHIADVSHYVKEDSNLGIEAYNRATSGYFGDKVVPMLPHKLSNGICSLNENVDRLAISCIMEIDNLGNIVSRDIMPSIIRSRKKMTYTDVNEILINNNIKEDYKPFSSTLLEMGKLSKILEKHFFKGGYIEFESKEPVFIFDDKRNVTNVKVREQKDAENLIEMFMLSANISVAEYISDFGMSLPYRVHDKPKEEKLKNFLNLLTTKGLVFNFDPKKLDGINYQNMIKEINSKFEPHVALVLNCLAIRTMSKAIYSTENIGHFGLGFNKYCHFTSPIRRFPDLTVHRIIKDILFNYNNEVVEKWNNTLDAICENSSKREQDSVNCERDVDKMLSASYLEDKVGNVYEAVISGVCPFGLFVELDNTIEGLIKIETLKNDTFVYDEKTESIVGRNKKNKYTFGDLVKVKLVDADAISSKIDFEIYTKEKQDATIDIKKIRKRK